MAIFDGVRKKVKPGEFTSDRRLYLNADDEVVEADDESRVTLLVGEGGTLSRERAVRYGLMEADGEGEAEGMSSAAGSDAGEGEGAEPREAGDEGETEPAAAGAATPKRGTKRSAKKGK